MKVRRFLLRQPRRFIASSVVVLLLRVSVRPLTPRVCVVRAFADENTLATRAPIAPSVLTSTRLCAREERQECVYVRSFRRDRG